MIYEISLDDSPASKYFIEMVKQLSFVSSISEKKKKKQETTDILLQDKELMKRVELHKKGKLPMSQTFSGNEFEEFVKNKLT